MTGKQSKISQLRMGKPIHKVVDLRGYQFAVVLVSIDTSRAIEEATQKYISENPDSVNEVSKNQFYEAQLAYHCLRDLDSENLSEKVADSVKEIEMELDAEDMNRVMTAYSELLMEKAPKLELMTEEQLTTVKKHLEVTPLSDLDTVSHVHLMNFHQAITLNN